MKAPSTNIDCGPAATFSPLKADPYAFAPSSAQYWLRGHRVSIITNGNDADWIAHPRRKTGSNHQSPSTKSISFLAACPEDTTAG